MSKLNSITIENIKGISSRKFDLDLYPNKPSVLVAPNGFGKSSVACAFKSMNNSRIALDDKDFHIGNPVLQPTMTVTLDTHSFQATSSSNDILKKFDVFVINSPVYAKAGKRYTGGSYMASVASLEVQPVVLIDTIPEKKEFDYSPAKYKTDFGANGKILPNATNLLANKDFIYEFDKVIDKSSFSKARLYQTPIANVLAEINSQSGTAASIKQYIANNLLPRLKAIPPLRGLAELISKFTNTNEVDQYLLAYQVARLTETANFKEAVKYQVYLRDKNFFDELLASMNSTRYVIKTKEVTRGQKKSLDVIFPAANEISNGQRDTLSFVAQIQRAKRRFSKDNCLLIIDEIFDYLDDANLVSFQYYITMMIEEFRQQGRFLYPLLLTHLDPGYFNHFCFNRHKIQIRYLAKNSGNPASDFLRIVKNRDESTIKDLVSKHWFHYHPTEQDLENEFQALTLKKAWAKSHHFYELANEEMQKYLNGKSYDPIGVLFAVRIKIEQLAYERLTTVQQQQFIDEHKTRNKLDYCSSQCGIEIPEIHYLLGIIYNDDLHWKDNRDYETPLYSKLANPTIKKMIEVISGSPVATATANPANDQTPNSSVSEAA